MKYVLKTPAAVDAYAVTDATPDFHGSKLVLLDDGTVKLAPSGAAAVGDYFVVPPSGPAHFADKAAFEEAYDPLAA